MNLSKLTYLNASLMLIVTVTVGLAACSGSGGSSSPTSPNPNNTNSSQISEKYQGVWLAPAYGKGFRFGSDSVELFDYTSRFCLLVAKDGDINDSDIEESFYLSDLGLENFGDQGTVDFHAPTEVFTKAAHMPDSCMTGFMPQVGEVGYQVDSLQDLELFFDLFNEYSVSLEVKNIDWYGIFQEARSTVYSDTLPLELLDIFSQMITPLSDIHTSVQSDVGFTKVENKVSQPYIYAQEYMDRNKLTLPLNSEEITAVNNYISAQTELHNTIIASYADEDKTIQSAANDQLSWFTVDSFGYLNIGAMSGFSDSGGNEESLIALEEALDVALFDLIDTDGLIIDIRTNGGGQDFLSLAIASRFVASKTLVYRKQAGLINNLTNLVDVYVSPRGQYQYLKPVVLLVSETTASAAEVFSLAMRRFDHVRLVGEATQGGFSDILPKRLFNGFEVNLSNERYLSTSNEWYEGQGVPVDIEVPIFTFAERDSGFDAAIEAAVQLLRQ